MRYRTLIVTTLVGVGLVAASAINGVGQGTPRPRPGTDAVQEAQTPAGVPRTRPEQQQTTHDRSNIFDGQNAPPSSSVCFPPGRVPQTCAPYYQGNFVKALYEQRNP